MLRTKEKNITRLIINNILHKNFLENPGTVGSGGMM